MTKEDDAKELERKIAKEFKDNKNRFHVERPEEIDPQAELDELAEFLDILYASQPEWIKRLFDSYDVFFNIAMDDGSLQLMFRGRVSPDTSAKVVEQVFKWIREHPNPFFSSVYIQ